MCQTSATATPNIDTTPPIMETPDLIGYRKGESTAIDASLVYSYTNITVNISCSDSESGLKEIELNGQTKKASAGVKNYVFNFAEIITKNTIQEPEYSIKLTDVAGNQNTIKIYPLKDSEMPHAIALSLNDWASVDSQKCYGVCLVRQKRRQSGYQANISFRRRRANHCHVHCGEYCQLPRK